MVVDASPSPVMASARSRRGRLVVVGVIGFAMTVVVLCNTIFLTTTDLNNQQRPQQPGRDLRVAYTMLQHRPPDALAGKQSIIAMAEGWDEMVAQLDDRLAVTMPGEEEEDVDALTDPSTTRPLRSAESMEKAQECFRRYQGFAYLLHMRKAGGSTLRSRLSGLVRRKQQHVVYVTEGDSFNVSCLKHDQGELVTITSLRHPVDRILSAYWYEGRYKLGERLLEDGGEGSKTAVPLKDWLVKMWQEEEGYQADFRLRRVWMSIENYYIKTLTNRYRQDLSAPIGREDFELAKRILASMDLVVITEWMGWKNQTAYLNDMLGEPSRLRLWAMNRLKTNRSREAIDDDALKLLHRINYYDVMLYEFAKRLVKSRLHAFQEKKAGGATGQGDGEEEVTCMPPVVDPRWRKDGAEQVAKPHPDSYLYTRPFCMLNHFKVDLIREVW